MRAIGITRSTRTQSVCRRPTSDHNITRFAGPRQPDDIYDRDKEGKGIHCKYVPGTYRPLANKDNDYLMDRTAQRRGSTYSGVEGIAIQDGSLQESMGPIIDRTKENLVSSDNGIIMARHRLMRAAKELAEKGTVPPGVDLAHQKVRSASVVLPPDQPFKDAAKEALRVRTGVAPATV